MGAALAHELNQPLTALMLYLDAVQRAVARDWDEDDLRSRSLANAVREAQRAAGIVQRMRGFLDRGDQRRRPVDLRALLDEAIELTKMGRRSKGISIVRRHDQAIAPVEADPIQLQQIFVNLLRNAFDAVQGIDHPEIEIATHSDAQWIRITVRDNGEGIATETLDDLFKVFSSGKRNGMGLGLAISRSIAQSHGGDLTVDPGGHGRGASFEVTLPRLHDASSQTP
jgi:two-component system, LuxR family, sensor kinase FixL